MKQKITALIMCMVIILSLCACGNSSTSGTGTQPASEGQSSTNSPQSNNNDTAGGDTVIIENMGITTTYAKAPETAVALSFSIAEIMVAMGLKDKIVADAASMYRIEQVSERYRAEVASIPELEGNAGVPTLETVLDTNAEFVFGDIYSFKANNCGVAEDYQKAGVNVYATVGTYVDDPSLESVYTDIINIGKIFRVDASAEKLVQELRAREAAVKESVAGLEPVRVFYLDSAGEGGEGTLSTIGNTGYQLRLLEMAGCKNVFDDTNGNFIDVSREQIIKRDPEYILVIDYYGSGYAEKLIEELKNSSDMSDLDAVKNDRFIILSGLAVFPSLESLELIEQVAKAVHP